MRRIGVLVVFSLLLATMGCRSPAAETWRDPAVRPQQERSIDEAVRELKARADAQDLNYFASFTTAEDRENAASVMRAVEATDVVGLYREHLTSSESTATIDGHSLGRFQVILVHGDSGWQVESLYPCY